MLTFAVAIAQPVPGDGGGGPESPCEFLPPEFRPDDCVPIDSWIYLAAAIGILVVARNKKRLFA